MTLHVEYFLVPLPSFLHLSTCSCAYYTPLLLHNNLRGSELDSYSAKQTSSVRGQSTYGGGRFTCSLSDRPGVKYGGGAWLCLFCVSGSGTVGDGDLTRGDATEGGLAWSCWVVAAGILKSESIDGGGSEGSSKAGGGGGGSWP